NEQNQTEVRNRETWILGDAPSTPDEFEETTIHCSSLVIKIQFPNHAAASPGYIQNLRAEPVTQAPSEIPTPHERLIYYQAEKIGEGIFGRVYKIVRKRDGKIFAAKVFSSLPNKNKR
ncbi:hypothetical protein M406DRAFT_251272, partial [Cryphonectria parasitica EP155]